MEALPLEVQLPAVLCFWNLIYLVDLQNQIYMEKRKRWYLVDRITEEGAGVRVEVGPGQGNILGTGTFPRV